MSFITIFRKDYAILTEEDIKRITKKNVLTARWNVSEGYQFGSMYHWIDFHIDENDYSLCISEHAKTSNVEDNTRFITIALTPQEYQYLLLKLR